MTTTDRDRLTAARLEAFRTIADRLQLYRRSMTAAAGPAAWPAYTAARPSVRLERARLAGMIRTALAAYAAADAAAVASYSA